jgi:hypothetical protein
MITNRTHFLLRILLPAGHSPVPTHEISQHPSEHPRVSLFICLKRGIKKFLSGQSVSIIRSSSVSIVTRLLAERPVFDSRQWQWRDLFSSPLHPDWLWGPPSLLCSGYQSFYLVGKVAGAWSWPLHLVQRLWMHGTIPPYLNTSSWRFA